MAVNWDTSEMQVTQSDLAQASADADGVRLDFGASMLRESGELTGVCLQQRILLDHEAAQNLLRLLNKLVLQQNRE